MSNNHAEGIEDFSKFFSENLNYMKYKFGSNYVYDEIAMSMGKEEKNKGVIGFIDNDVDDSGN